MPLPGAFLPDFPATQGGVPVAGGRARIGTDATGPWIEWESERLRTVHALGVTPLQQFVVAAGDGRHQVLPVSWDARSAEAGGQRWFVLGETAQRDRLHWRQPLMRWEGMCADCHAVGLRRGYDEGSDRFAARYVEAGVGCGSCHTQTVDHHTSSAPGSGAEAPGLRWVFAPGADTAQPQGLRRPGSMDTCFACHSLREPLVDGIDPGTPYLDQFKPTLPLPPLYHADGQVREEVYVYGSFVQSKMFARGVECGNCHNAHTLELRAQGDALCGQCHSLPVFATKQHTGHPAASDGARCVGCHMPATTYMQIDPRRDHAFSIPRPELSIEHEVPNACNRCHAQQDARWALQHVRRWHGDKAIPVRVRQRVQALAGAPLAEHRWQAMVADPAYPAIVRGALLQARPEFAPPASAFAAANPPLVLLGALGAATRLPEAQARGVLMPLLQHLLQHPLRSVRVEAARALAVRGARVPAAAAAVLPQLSDALAQGLWRGEGRVNRALVAQGLGDPAAAEADYRAAIRFDPYFEGAYVNLADLLRAAGRDAAGGKVLQQGIERLPDAAALRYANALYRVRHKDYAGGLDAAQQALALGPDNPEHAVVYALLLDANGRTRDALVWLRANLHRYAPSPRLRSVGLQFANKLGDGQAAAFFAVPQRSDKKPAIVPAS